MTAGPEREVLEGYLADCTAIDIFDRRIDDSMALKVIHVDELTSVNADAGVTLRRSQAFHTPLSYSRLPCS